MATWPTAIQPQRATDLDPPKPLISTPTHGGSVNTRELPTTGHSWSETYLLDMKNASHLGWMAQIKSIISKGQVITDKTHPDHGTTLGVPGGTPLVKLGSQTGGAIATYGWTPNQSGLLVAGDLVQFAGETPVYFVVGSVDSDGSGEASMSLAPSMFEGNSPAADAAVTVTDAVTFNVVIIPPWPVWPDTGADGFGIITVNFREV